jgi:vesicle-fusing ATPase
MDYRGLPLLFTVTSVTLTALGQQDGGAGAVLTDPNSRGILVQQTEILLTADGRDQRTGLKLKSSATGSTRKAIITSDFSFTDIGIGGLDDEFAILFRREFASRVFPPQFIERLKIQHVKGILLYGPPGTGKTLIARQIGKVLNAKEPKVINGPEVLNKYVGQSEENIRKVFADAEKEYKERGDESDLHIIIFDELDAVCKQRGSGVGGGTGVGDSIVNQLLTKLDGVDQLNNILLIGMTNRKDMIDEALLRPGRLELQLEISLPDEHGRVQILNIHTSEMRQNGVLADDVDVEEIAKLTKNFSGAEIAGLVRSATSFALNRHMEANERGVVAKNTENLKVGREDFMCVHPPSSYLALSTFLQVSLNGSSF